MLTNKAKFLALLTAVIVVFGGTLTSDVQAATKTKAVKKRLVTTRQVKPKTVRIATLKLEPSEVADEPISKCLVQTIKDLHTKAQKQFDLDVAKYGKDRAGAVDRYRYRLDISWEAMNDPYCGYGQKTGLGDEIHSFKKSTERARGDFLAAAKR